MRAWLFLFSIIWCLGVRAQDSKNLSPFDGSYWGLVLDPPNGNKVRTKQNVAYGKTLRELHLDIYLPTGLGKHEKRPTIIIANGIGDQADEKPLKDSPAQVSWARLLASNGFVVVTMESEVNQVQDAFDQLFVYLERNGLQEHIDTSNLGIQAFSANCRETFAYAMSARAFHGIRGLVLYYPTAPSGPFRRDLPVQLMIAGFDVRASNYDQVWKNVLISGAPWSIALAPGLPHAFDIFSDSDASRRLILSTIEFWKAQLCPLPRRTTAFSEERAIVAATYDPDPSKKLKMMQRWIEQHPDATDGYAFSQYASALLENQRFAEAETCLRKAIDLEPTKRGNYLMMAVAELALGKENEAWTSIRDYEHNATPEEFTYSYVANRMMQIKKYREALSLYRRSIEFPNAPAYVHYNLGICLAKLDKIDDAFHYLQEAIGKGFSSRSAFESESALDGLHNDPRWALLLEKLP